MTALLRTIDEVALIIGRREQGIEGPLLMIVINLLWMIS